MTGGEEEVVVLEDWNCLMKLMWNVLNMQSVVWSHRQ